MINYGFIIIVSVDIPAVNREPLIIRLGTANEASTAAARCAKKQTENSYVKIVSIMFKFYRNIFQPLKNRQGLLCNYFEKVEYLQGH